MKPDFRRLCSEKDPERGQEADVPEDEIFDAHFECGTCQPKSHYIDPEMPLGAPSLRTNQIKGNRLQVLRKIVKDDDRSRTLDNTLQKLRNYHNENREHGQPRHTETAEKFEKEKSERRRERIQRLTADIRKLENRLRKINQSNKGKRTTVDKDSKLRKIGARNEKPRGLQRNEESRKINFKKKRTVCGCSQLPVSTPRKKSPVSCARHKCFQDSQRNSKWMKRHFLEKLGFIPTRSKMEREVKRMAKCSDRSHKSKPSAVRQSNMPQSASGWTYHTSRIEVPDTWTSVSFRRSAARKRRSQKKLEESQQKMKQRQEQQSVTFNRQTGGTSGSETTVDDHKEMSQELSKDNTSSMSDLIFRSSNATMDILDKIVSNETTKLGDSSSRSENKARNKNKSPSKHPSSKRKISKKHRDTIVVYTEPPILVTPIKTVSSKGKTRRKTCFADQAVSRPKFSRGQLHGSKAPESRVFERAQELYHSEPNMTSTTPTQVPRYVSTTIENSGSPSINVQSIQDTIAQSVNEALTTAMANIVALATEPAVSAQECRPCSDSDVSSDESSDEIIIMSATDSGTDIACDTSGNVSDGEFTATQKIASSKREENVALVRKMLNEFLSPVAVPCKSARPEVVTDTTYATNQELSTFGASSLPDGSKMVKGIAEERCPERIDKSSHCQRKPVSDVNTGMEQGHSPEISLERIVGKLTSVLEQNKQLTVAETQMTSQFTPNRVVSSDAHGLDRVRGMTSPDYNTLKESEVIAKLSRILESKQQVQFAGVVNLEREPSTYIHPEKGTTKSDHSQELPRPTAPDQQRNSDRLGEQFRDTQQNRTLIDSHPSQQLADVTTSSTSNARKHRRAKEKSAQAASDKERQFVSLNKRESLTCGSPKETGVTEVLSRASHSDIPRRFAEVTQEENTNEDPPDSETLERLNSLIHAVLMQDEIIQELFKPDPSDKHKHSVGFEYGKRPFNETEETLKDNKNSVSYITPQQGIVLEKTYTPPSSEEDIQLVGLAAPADSFSGSASHGKELEKLRSQTCDAAKQSDTIRYLSAATQSDHQRQFVGVTQERSPKIRNGVQSIRSWSSYASSQHADGSRELSTQIQSDRPKQFAGLAKQQSSSSRIHETEEDPERLMGSLTSLEPWQSNVTNKLSTPDPSHGKVPFAELAEMGNTDVCFDDEVFKRLKSIIKVALQEDETMRELFKLASDDKQRQFAGVSLEHIKGIMSVTSEQSEIDQVLRAPVTSHKQLQLTGTVEEDGTLCDTITMEEHYTDVTQHQGPEKGPSEKLEQMDSLEFMSPVERDTVQNLSTSTSCDKQKQFTGVTHQEESSSLQTQKKLENMDSSTNMRSRPDIISQDLSASITSEEKSQFACVIESPSRVLPKHMKQNCVVPEPKILKLHIQDDIYCKSPQEQQLSSRTNPHPISLNQIQVEFSCETIYESDNRSEESPRVRAKVMGNSTTIKAQDLVTIAETETPTLSPLGSGHSLTEDQESTNKPTLNDVSIVNLHDTEDMVNHMEDKAYDSNSDIQVHRIKRIIQERCKKGGKVWSCHGAEYVQARVSAHSVDKILSQLLEPVQKKDGRQDLDLESATSILNDLADELKDTVEFDRHELHEIISSIVRDEVNKIQTSSLRKTESETPKSDKSISTSDRNDEEIDASSKCQMQNPDKETSRKMNENMIPFSEEIPFSRIESKSARQTMTDNEIQSPSSIGDFSQEVLATLGKTDSTPFSDSKHTIQTEAAKSTERAPMERELTLFRSPLIRSCDSIEECHLKRFQPEKAVFAQTMHSCSSETINSFINNILECSKQTLAEFNNSETISKISHCETIIQRMVDTVDDSKYDIPITKVEVACVSTELKSFIAEKQNLKNSSTRLANSDRNSNQLEEDEMSGLDVCKSSTLLDLMNDELLCRGIDIFAPHYRTDELNGAEFDDETAYILVALSAMSLAYLEKCRNTTVLNQIQSSDHFTASTESSSSTYTTSSFELEPVIYEILRQAERSLTETRRKKSAHSIVKKTESVFGNCSAVTITTDGADYQSTTAEMCPLQGSQPDETLSSQTVDSTLTEKISSLIDNVLERSKQTVVESNTKDAIGKINHIETILKGIINAMDGIRYDISTTKEELACSAAELKSFIAENQSSTETSGLTNAASVSIQTEPIKRENDELEERKMSSNEVSEQNCEVDVLSPVYWMNRLKESQFDDETAYILVALAAISLAHLSLNEKSTSTTVHSHTLSQLLCDFSSSTDLSFTHPSSYNSICTTMSLELVIFEALVQAAESISEIRKKESAHSIVKEIENVSGTNSKSLISANSTTEKEDSSTSHIVDTEEKRPFSLDSKDIGLTTDTGEAVKNAVDSQMILTDEETLAYIIDNTIAQSFKLILSSITEMPNDDIEEISNHLHENKVGSNGSIKGSACPGKLIELMNEIEIQLREYINVLVQPCMKRFRSETKHVGQGERDIEELVKNVTSMVLRSLVSSENDVTICGEHYRGKPTSISDHLKSSSPEPSSKSSGTDRQSSKLSESSPVVAISKEKLSTLSETIEVLVKEKLEESIVQYQRDAKLQHPYGNVSQSETQVPNRCDATNNDASMTSESQCSLLPFDHELYFNKSPEVLMIVDHVTGSIFERMDQPKTPEEKPSGGTVQITNEIIRQAKEKNRVHMKALFLFKVVKIVLQSQADFLQMNTAVQPAVATQVSAENLQNQVPTAVGTQTSAQSLVHEWRSGEAIAEALPDNEIDTTELYNLCQPVSRSVMAGYKSAMLGKGTSGESDGDEILSDLIDGIIERVRNRQLDNAIVIVNNEEEKTVKKILTELVNEYLRPQNMLRNSHSDGVVETADVVLQDYAVAGTAGEFSEDTDSASEIAKTESVTTCTDSEDNELTGIEYESVIYVEEEEFYEDHVGARFFANFEKGKDAVMSRDKSGGVGKRIKNEQYLLVDEAQTEKSDTIKLLEKDTNIGKESILKKSGRKQKKSDQKRQVKFDPSLAEVAQEQLEGKVLNKTFVLPAEKSRLNTTRRLLYGNEIEDSLLPIEENNKLPDDKTESIGGQTQSNHARTINVHSQKKLTDAKESEKNIDEIALRQLFVTVGSDQKDIFGKKPKGDENHTRNDVLSYMRDSNTDNKTKSDNGKGTGSKKKTKKTLTKLLKHL